jgi:hypothetical protein
MRIQDAAIVLGAGASKGAQIVGGRTPPLDTEFLEVAANYFKGKKARGAGRERVLAWNSFKTHLRSAGLDFSIVKTWPLSSQSVQPMISTRPGLQLTFNYDLIADDLSSCRRF